MNDTKFFGVSLKTSFIPFYDEVVARSKECDGTADPEDLNYVGLSIGEMCECDKDNNEIIDEYFARVKLSLNGVCRYYIRKYPYLSMDNLYNYLQNTALIAFKKFQNRRGAFDNFFFKMLQLGSAYYRIKEGKDFLSETKRYGVKMGFDESMFFNHSYDMAHDTNYGKNIRIKLDLEEYCSRFTKREQQILQMYLYSYTFRQIAAYNKIPLSTASNFVRRAMTNFVDHYFSDGTLPNSDI